MTDINELIAKLERWDSEAGRGFEMRTGGKPNYPYTTDGEAAAALRTQQARIAELEQSNNEEAALRVGAIERLNKAEARITELEADRDRIERNRDMWKGQCERQAEALRAAEAGRDAAVLAEREACAQIADPIEHSGPWTDYEKQAYDIRTTIASSIRARSNGAAAQESRLCKNDNKYSVSIPTGWKLVPIEPTRLMEYAFISAWDSATEKSTDQNDDPFDWFGKGYTAMLAAAPTPPVADDRIETLINRAFQRGFIWCQANDGGLAYLAKAAADHADCAMAELRAPPASVSDLDEEKADG